MAKRRPRINDIQVDVHVNGAEIGDLTGQRRSCCPITLDSPIIDQRASRDRECAPGELNYTVAGKTVGDREIGRVAGTEKIDSATVAHHRAIDEAAPVVCHPQRALIVEVRVDSAV